MSSNHPLRHALEYAGFRTAEALYASLSPKRASDLSGQSWRLVAPKLKRHSRALAHLRDALPEKTEAEREAIALEMWETLGRVFGESFHLRELTGPERFEIADEEAWKREVARNGSRGFVVASAHLGNWEISAAGLGRIGLRTAGLYQKITNPRVDARIRDMRSFIYPAGLFAKESGTPRRLLRCLKEGNSIAMLADLRDPTGFRVPFFGRPASATRFPALLARHMDVPLLVGRVERLPDLRFRGTLQRIEVPRTGDAETDMFEATAAIQRQIEAWIRETPGQWMWAHRRWA